MNLPLHRETQNDLKTQNFKAHSLHAIKLLRVSRPLQNVFFFKTVQLMNLVFCKMTDIIKQNNFFCADFLF